MSKPIEAAWSVERSSLVVMQRLSQQHMQLFCLLLSIYCLSFTASFKPLQQAKVSSRRASFGIFSSRYVPPELDPEYRNIVIKPRIPTDIQQRKTAVLNSTDINEATGELYPAPKEGDIVQYKGRFGEKDIGRIRFLQFVPTYDTYFADIVPMKEGGSENVFVLDRESKAEYLSLKELAPIKFFFVRSENGYKTYRSKVDGGIVLKAPRYRQVDKNYNTRTKAIDFTKLKVHHTLIHSYTHTLIHSNTHTLMHSYTHTLIHSYTHTLIHLPRPVPRR